MTFVLSAGDEQPFRLYGRSVTDETALRMANLAMDEGQFRLAAGYLEPLLKQEDPEAQYLASCFSVEDESSDAYKERRILLLRRASERRYPPALFALAVAYDTGDGLTIDKRKASELFMEAAVRGHAHSQWICSIDFIYDDSSKYRSQGIELLFKSADQGFVGALQTLVKLYTNGDCGFPKCAKLAEYFRRRSVDTDVIDY
jgi:TPR repeat protein